MMLLVFGLLVFGGLHLVSAVPGAKAALKARFGKAYGPLFGIATLLSLFFVFWAFRQADRSALYDPPDWGRHANFLLTLIAFVFFGIFAFRGSWRNVIKYPLLAGFLFWGVGHLFANGDSATLIFVCGLVGIAVLHVVLVRRNGPFVPSDVRNGHNLLSVLFGIAFYGVFAQLHGVIVGVPVLSLT
jgi:uncharacterized membrane protein